jgi:hypothetical protein
LFSCKFTIIRIVDIYNTRTVMSRKQLLASALKFSLSAIVIFTAIFSILLIQQKVRGVDSYFHIRYAWIIRTQGIFNTQFPYLPFSSLSKYNADLWYGFHLLLIPFTYYEDLFVGMQVATAVIATTGLLLCWLCFKRLHIWFPFFWSVVLFIGTGSNIHRFLMMRPEAISFGFTMLLFSAALTNSPILVFLAALGASFFHVSVLYISLCVITVTLLVHTIIEKNIQWKLIITFCAGSCLGLLLNPNPIGILYLTKINSIDLLLAKLSHAPLTLGQELWPFPLPSYISSIALLFTSGLLLYLAHLYTKQKLSSLFNVSLISSFVLFIFFSILTVIIAQRSDFYAVGFLVIFIGITATNYLTYIFSIHKENQLTTIIHGTIMGTVCILLLFTTLHSWFDAQSIINQLPSNRTFREAGMWLRNNTKPGDLVAYVQWEYFAPLFYYSWENRYVEGIDPTFLYVSNPTMSWKLHYLSKDTSGEYTCGVAKCSSATTEDTYYFLIHDLNASYVFLQKDRNPKLTGYLTSHPNQFTQVYSNKQEMIYKILIP